LLPDNAREHVGGAAGGERDDVGDRLRRPLVLREQGCRDTRCDNEHGNDWQNFPECFHLSISLRPGRGTTIAQAFGRGSLTQISRRWRTALIARRRKDTS